MALISIVLDEVILLVILFNVNLNDLSKGIYCKASMYCFPTLGLLTITASICKQHFKYGDFSTH